MKARTLTISALLLFISAPLFGAAPGAATPDKWLDLGAALAANGETTPMVVTTPASTKAPPIPIHTFEGVGGGTITPMAYLINRGPVGTVVGLPTASYTFVRLGSKKVHATAVTQTFFRRIELGYAMNNMDVGSLDDDVEKILGIDIARDDIYLHHFNVRAMLIEEDSFNLPLPALTAGIHFKYNDTINKFDRRLNNALEGIGFDKKCGVDYTLTATKMFAELAFGRPIIVTAGLRLGSGAQMGFLGFADHCNLTFEGSVGYMPLDNLLVLYEFRHKENPYHKIDKIVGDENNWHALNVTYVFNEHFTVSGGWIYGGNIANSHADGGWCVQAKWEF
jgi:hypothetical protein